jgi:chemotaxis protein histidine kinase CheA
MKHSQLRLHSLALLCGLALSSATVRAAECPATSPEYAEERRALAKQWFATAEAAEKDNDNVEAIRAYACSMKMVAHPYTAYNLGRVAERAGDLELALKSYKAYLTLKSDAQDKDQVQTRVEALEGKIAAAKKPAVAETAAAEQEGNEENEDSEENEVEAPPNEASPSRARESGSPAEPDAVAPRPTRTPAPEQSYAAEWVIGGVGVAALATGIVLNLKARSKMDDCNSLDRQNMLKSANDACDGARPLAYGSYALFGVTALAAITDSVLLFRGPSNDVISTAMSLGWAPGMPLTLSARGRF